MARFGAVAIFVMFAIINPVVSDLCLKGASMSLSQNFNPKASDFTEKTQCSSGEKCMRSKLVLDGGTMIMQICVGNAKLNSAGGCGPGCCYQGSGSEHVKVVCKPGYDDAPSASDFENCNCPCREVDWSLSKSVIASLCSELSRTAPMLHMSAIVMLMVTVSMLA
mmetsp:Transcript_120489/g.239806  ORF Transcript_120489/g.239806 Transcript_120489/m.239806 type:complete len:165 (-) Transcript_120489:214-708(-)